MVFGLRGPVALVKTELASAAMRRALCAEFLGCLLFVVFGAGTAIVTGGLLGEKLASARLLVIALAHGVAFLLLVAATLPISGGHLNPAITFAAMLVRKISVMKAVMYTAVQCAGAACGATLLTFMIPAGTQGNLGTHMLGLRVTVGGGLTTEIVLTFMLVSAVFATTMNGSRPVALGAAAIGLASVLGYLFALPLTGASMNPARSFGPAFVTGFWKDQWIFWVGPLAGGALAAFVHEYLASSDRRS
jgi:MIP family channel proteins